MIMIQISDSKKKEMSELVEDILHMGGRLMQCIENLEGGAMGERRREYDMDDTPMSGDYGERYPDYSRMGMRGRDSRGRYSRY